jgi:hypothetical protein
MPGVSGQTDISVPTSVNGRDRRCITLMLSISSCIIIGSTEKIHLMALNTKRERYNAGRVFMMAVDPSTIPFPHSTQVHISTERTRNNAVVSRLYTILPIHTSHFAFIMSCESNQKKCPKELNQYRFLTFFTR